MRVQVDEAGAEHRARAVDDLRRLDAAEVADRRDQPVRDADVRDERRALARDRPWRRGRRGQTTADMPPSTYRIWPFTKSDAADARKTTAPASSDGSPQRPAGTRCRQPRVELGVRRERLGQLGAEVARADRVRLDVEARPVGAHRAGQHLQPALRRRVAADRRAREVAHDRADRDDLPGAALDHLRRHRARDEERARQVHVEQLAPLGERELLERLAQRHARVRDEHVDPAERGDARRDRVLVGDVERRRDRALDLRRALLARRRRAAVDRDPRARVRERLREREPEPARRAGHERGPAGQVEEAHRQTTGSTTCDGYAAVCRTVWCATSIRVPVPTSSPVFRLREKRGKLELVTSRRMRWPFLKRFAIG